MILGHNNIIALSGTEIQADDTLRDLSVKSRNCLFPEENTNMKIYKNYTYSNCIFECSLMYAKDRLAQSYNNSRPCMPWFYPSTDKSVTICEPWAAVKFLEFMNGDIPNDVCSYCLPDCRCQFYLYFTSSYLFKNALLSFPLLTALFSVFGKRVCRGKSCL